MFSEPLSNVGKQISHTCAFQSCCVLNNRVRFCHKTFTSGIRCLNNTGGKNYFQSQEDEWSDEAEPL